MKKLLLSAFLLAGAFAASAQATKPPINTDTLAAPGLPVLRTYVPPDAVFRAAKKFGRSLYCIAEVVHPNGKVNYRVGLIKRGRLTMEWLDEELKMV